MAVQQKDVSVILPVYNTEPYLRRCMDSLLNQTLKNIEIIIVNDASPDQSEALIKEVYLQYNFKNFIRYIRHRCNKGLGFARNTGLQNAHGKYVVFVDSDDWLDLDCLKSLFLAAESSQADIVSAGAVLSYTDGKEKKLVCNPLQGQGGIDLWNQLNIGFMKHVVWNKIYKRDFIEQYALRFYPLNMGEDSLFNFEATVFCEKYVLLSEAFYHYYQTEQSNFRGKASIKQIKQLFQMECIIKEIKEKLNFYKGIEIEEDLLFQYFFSLNFNHCLSRFYQQTDAVKNNEILRKMFMEEFGDKYFYVKYFFDQYVKYHYDKRNV